MQPRKIQRRDTTVAEPKFKPEPKPFVPDRDTSAHIISFMDIADVCGGLGNTCSYNQRRVREATNALHAPRFKDRQVGIAMCVLRREINSPRRAYFNATFAHILERASALPMGNQRMRITAVGQSVWSLASSRVNHKTIEGACDAARTSIDKHIDSHVKDLRRIDAVCLERRRALDALNARLGVDVGTLEQRE